jgi:hypothetical protein
MRRIEKLETWPSLRVTVELMPWHWALWAYRDACEPWYWRLIVGPLTVECVGNWPPFAIARSGDTTGGDE